MSAAAPARKREPAATPAPAPAKPTAPDSFVLAICLGVPGTLMLLGGLFFMLGSDAPFKPGVFAVVGVGLLLLWAINRAVLAIVDLRGDVLNRPSV
ncbi:hypothetical protein [Alienimonas sp. DA493]|uniref:hypothetical protein n=1 Tax=Alienimonas sp. DA493 TaxID=3373605 RepID=UPI0037552999